MTVADTHGNHTTHRARLISNPLTTGDSPQPHAAASHQQIKHMMLLLTDTHIAGSAAVGVTAAAVGVTAAAVGVTAAACASSPNWGTQHKHFDTAVEESGHYIKHSSLYRHAMSDA
jgi:hypothetical protein